LNREKFLGGWPPKNCNIPDLSSLYDKNILVHILSLNLRGTGSRNLQARAFVNSYVRLMDYVIREYNNARASLEEYVNSPNTHMSPLFVSTCHFETCIITLVRLIRLARRIRRHRGAPNVGKLEVLSNSVFDRINNIRRAIEHVDEMILKGEIGVKDSPFFLLVKNNSIELSGKEIFYTELAEWVRELYSLNDEIINYFENEKHEILKKGGGKQ